MQSTEERAQSTEERARAEEQIKAAKPETYEKYEDAKKRLFMFASPVHREALRESKIPHKVIGDIMLIYMIDLRDDGIEEAAPVVIYEMLGKWGVSPKQLHEDAMASQKARKPPKLSKLGDAIREMAAELEKPLPEREFNSHTWMATVEGRRGGAAVMWFQDFMERAAEEIGGSFYILPASVSELILVKDEDSIAFGGLLKALLFGNLYTCPPSDFLSNTVYHYDKRLKAIETGDNYALRMGHLEV